MNQSVHAGNLKGAKLEDKKKRVSLKDVVTETFRVLDSRNTKIPNFLNTKDLCTEAYYHSHHNQRQRF